MADDGKDKQDDLKGIGTAVAGSTGNIVLAVGVLFFFDLILNIVGKLLGYGPLADRWPFLSMAVFFGILFSNPLDIWTEGKPVWRVAVAFAFGFGLGWFVPTFGESMLTPSKEGGLASIWIGLMIIPVGIFAVAMGKHAFDRFLANHHLPMPERIKDAAIEYLDTCGPTLNLVVFGIVMLAYYLVQPPVWVALVLMGVVILATCTWSALYADEAAGLQDDEDEPMHPRSQTLPEAASKVLDVSVQMLPSALYMAGLLWLLILMFPELDSLKGLSGDEQMWSLISFILQTSALALVVFPAGIVLTIMIVSAYFLLLGPLFGLDALQREARTKSTTDGLLMGGMGRLFHGQLEDRKPPSA